MLLVCPSCASAYQVPDARIGRNGRTVRCKRCATMWYATLPDEFDRAVAPIREAAEAVAPAFASLASGGEAAAAAIAEEDSPAAALPAVEEIVIGKSEEEPPEPESPAAIEIEGEVLAPPQGPAGRPAPRPSLLSRWMKWLRPPPRPALVSASEAEASLLSAAARASPPPVAARKPPSRRRGRAAAPAAAFALASLAVAAVGLREPIGAASPAMARLYAGLGLRHAAGPVAILRVGSEISVRDGVEVLLVEGELANNGGRVRPAPGLTAIVRDEKGVALYEWPAQTLKATLEPGERTLFRARLATPPPRGHSVEVRFADAPAEKPAPGRS